MLIFVFVPYLWYLSGQLVQCHVFVFVMLVKISNAVSVFVFLESDSKCKIISNLQLQVQPIRARLELPSLLDASSPQRSVLRIWLLLQLPATGEMSMMKIEEVYWQDWNF